jgi:hypothetical protein
MLVAACAFLGIAAQPIGQALTRRSGAQAKPFSEAVIETD